MTRAVQAAKGGRPRYEPTEKERSQVRTLAAMGIPHTDIAIVLQISTPTLRRHFRRELDVGAIEANAKVAATLYRAAVDEKRPSVVAQIFWLKVRAGWSESAGADQKEPREQALGKKEVASRAARTAQEGTGWAGLLPGQASLQ